MEYVFDQRVMERNRTAADVVEALGQQGSFRMLIAIDSDSHSVTERKLRGWVRGRKMEIGCHALPWGVQILKKSAFSLMTDFVIPPKCER